MKKILLTTDLSESSRKAFSVAKAHAKAFDATIVLLAIIEDPSQAAMIYAMDFPIQPDPDIRQQLVEKVRKDLDELVGKELSDVKCDAHVVEANGPTHAEIINYAKENDVDMLVIATHGRTGLSRILIGSVAEKVVRESHCPVLTVPVS